MLTDPIADMLTRIRNAHLALHKEVNVPRSKMKESLAAILKQEGYVDDVTVDEGGIKSPSNTRRVKPPLPASAASPSPDAAFSYVPVTSRVCRMVLVFAFFPPLPGSSTAKLPRKRKLVVNFCVKFGRRCSYV